MCQEVCDRATQDPDCRGYDLTLECGDSEYYGMPPNCYMIDYGVTSESNTWQYILAGLVAGIGLLIFLSLAYRWIKNRLWKPDPNAPIEFEDERKTHEEEQKRGEQYQDLEHARPFTSGDGEFRTAQQARADILAREEGRRSITGPRNSQPQRKDTTESDRPEGRKESKEEGKEDDLEQEPSETESNQVKNKPNQEITKRGQVEDIEF